MLRVPDDTERLNVSASSYLYFHLSNTARDRENNTIFVIKPNNNELNGNIIKTDERSACRRNRGGCTSY